MSHKPILLDEGGKPAKPWLTVIEDDYSRAIASFRLSFQESTALTTALALRQGIWRKSDPRWHICGIPSTFYTDHGSDFTSKHLEQVADDLDMVLIFSETGEPRGRGKVERFFRSVEQLLLQDLPGYAPKGARAVEAKLTLPEFEQLYWLLGASVQKQARPDGERSSFPACKQRWVGVPSDVVDSILMLERRYS